MTMTKNATVREIGRRTRLKNRDVQLVLETLIEVWTDELVSGGRIEIEHFMVIDVQTVEGLNPGVQFARPYVRLRMRAAKRLKRQLQRRTGLR